MERLPVAGGHVVIKDRVVETDLSIINAMQRLHQQSRVISWGLILSVAFLALAAVVGYPPGIRVIVLVGILILVAYVIAAFSINKFLRPQISREKTIPRDAIKIVVYDEGGTIRRPNFSIVYEKDGEKKIRSILLSPRFLGGDAPLERVLRRFEEAGIETTSADELESP